MEVLRWAKGTALSDRQTAVSANNATLKYQQLDKNKKEADRKEQL